MKKLAKLKYLPNNFKIIENGDHVLCAVSGKKISLENLNYWNVETQEAYFSYKEALTTTIPAQFIKKFNAEVVPINIERSIDDNFKIRIFDNIQFSENDSVEKITLELNKILEKMIVANPKQWIWTHNRWKL